ncbi:MAG: hypothetical protein KKC20_21070 [Proteobacteria bacterium]|nr:hypothetical protein [Pseudomonadota bacterium]
MSEWLGKENQGKIETEIDKNMAVESDREIFVEIQRTQILVKNLFTSMPATPVNAIILVIILWEVIPRNSLVAWCLINIAFVLVRYVVIGLFFIPTAVLFTLGTQTTTSMAFLGLIFFAVMSMNARRMWSAASGFTTFFIWWTRRSMLQRKTAATLPLR